MSALRLATLFQMTYPGAPSIYYGDEIGMAGGHDPANRGAFPWHQTESWNTELLHEFQRLIALRRQRAVPASRDVSVPLGDRPSGGLRTSTGSRNDDRRPERREANPPARFAGGQSACRGSGPDRVLVARLIAVERAKVHDLVIGPRAGRVLINTS